MNGLRSLIEGGKPALARALAAIEQAPGSEATLALLDAAWAAPRAHVLGLTGPPGVGKSTLLSALARRWRAAGRTVGIVAVDPSSRRSGGALLGDRTRLDVDPDDQGVYVRSMAARDRLGGVAGVTAAAATLMRAVHDVVVIETVGVGQSETDIADLVDTVLLAIQPGSGDSLQFMKAGIAEIPDVAVVTKADLGAVAARAKVDLEAALALGPALPGRWQPPAIEVAAAEGRGIDELLATIARHAAHLASAGLAARRLEQEKRWLRAAIRDEHGRQGLHRAEALLGAALDDTARSPFLRLDRVAKALAAADRDCRAP